jgi:hypothetical protein
MVILCIAGILITASVMGLGRMKSSLEYVYSINQITSDIKLTQQLADASMQLCSIDFKAGGSSYTITKGGILIRTCHVGSAIKFGGKDHFSFVQSRYTDVGGSGTLLVESPAKVKKIIVSSRGRIRVE